MPSRHMLATHRGTDFPCWTKLRSTNLASEVFDDERRQWEAQLESGDPGANTPTGALQPTERDRRTIVVESHVHGSVWKVLVALGDPVEPGQTLLLVESMKMEITVASTVAGTVTEILVSEGREVAPGQALVVVIPINAGNPR